MFKTTLLHMKQTILAMYSGGLDSLGMLYKLLTEDAYKDYNLHIHHIHNVNVENRHHAESVVVNQVKKELANLGFNFIYSESKIITPPFNNRFMVDVDMMNFFAGYVASVNPDIVRVAIGQQASDGARRLEERRIRGQKIFSVFSTAEKIYPVGDMTKRQIYDILPESLRNKFWSCRRPNYEQKIAKPCLGCDTCQALQDQGIPFNMEMML